MIVYLELTQVFQTYKHKNENKNAFQILSGGYSNIITTPLNLTFWHTTLKLSL